MPSAHRVVGRALTVLVLLLATPGPTQIVRDVVALTAEPDCCDDDCDDGTEQSCPGTCGHCVCCAHPNVLPTATQIAAATPLAGELEFVAGGERPCAQGYRAPPFRPPAG
jgi:hypothetical protein